MAVIGPIIQFILLLSARSTHEFVENENFVKNYVRIQHWLII